MFLDEDKFLAFLLPKAFVLVYYQIFHVHREQVENATKTIGCLAEIALLAIRPLFALTY